MSIEKHRGLRTWIEVNQKAVRHNVGLFRRFLPKRALLMAVVKSNAYGHGLLPFAKEMEKLGADLVRSKEPLVPAGTDRAYRTSNRVNFLGVDSILEARALRREGVALPILVLGYTLPQFFAEAAENDISLTISSSESLAALNKARLAKPLMIHIKVDTGMHRQGFLATELPKILAFLLRIKDKGLRIEAEGLYTHFASAKNPAFPQDTQTQLAAFKKWVSAFQKAGLKPIVHAAATGGALLFPESHFDMVRIGIGLYGVHPSRETEAHFTGRLVLQPALSWKTIITEIKRVPKGARVGYDLTETLPRDSRLAILPVGYWHGYPRALSSIGRVLIRGRAARVIGRVSMDMLTVDVTEIPQARVGDEVILLGGSGKAVISADTLASLADLSPYELITRLNPLIKRLYV